jgi:hypothetical protein
MQHNAIELLNIDAKNPNAVTALNFYEERSQQKLRQILEGPHSTQQGQNQHSESARTGGMNSLTPAIDPVCH